MEHQEVLIVYHHNALRSSLHFKITPLSLLPNFTTWNSYSTHNFIFSFSFWLIYISIWLLSPTHTHTRTPGLVRLLIDSNNLHGTHCFSFGLGPWIWRRFPQKLSTCSYNLSTTSSSCTNRHHWRGQKSIYDEQVLSLVFLSRFSMLEWSISSSWKSNMAIFMNNLNSQSGWM